MLIYEIFKNKNGKKGDRITSTESLIELEVLKEKFGDKILVESWKIKKNIPYNMGEV